MESTLWWMKWDEVLAVFVEGFLLTFVGGVVILKVHIWEHSGPFGYLIPIWLVVLIWRGGAGWLCEVFSFAIIVKGGGLCRGSGLRI